MNGTLVTTWKELYDIRGSYMKNADGVWYAHAPAGRFVANLANHQITEHEDGTITVSPSILVSQSNVGSWHGYLERGVWREC